MKRIITCLVAALVLALVAAPADATISTTTTRYVYDGSTSTGPYAIPFYFAANSDVAVIKVDTATLSVETVLVENTHYTISGTGLSGSVTLTSALTSSYKLVIMRAMDFLQATDFEENEPFTAATVDAHNDKVAQELLQLKDASDRSLQLPKAIGSGYNVFLPKPQASKLLGVDSTGKAWQYYPITTVYSVQIDDISNYGNSLSTLVATLGSTKRTVHVGSAITVDGNVTVPANIELWIAQGGSIEPASGIVVTINQRPMAGPYQIFAGDGTIRFGDGVTPVFPEWWGAISDGDQVTDDGPAFTAAVAAMPLGSELLLEAGGESKGYWLSASYSINIDSYRLTIRGQGHSTIYSSSTGYAIRVHAANSELKGISVKASSGNERNNANQSGILITNTTGIVVDTVGVDGFYSNWNLYVDSALGAPLYIESCSFTKANSTDGQIGWNMHTNRTRWTSFSANRWEQCLVNITQAAAAAGTITNSRGVYFGEYIDLYKSNMDFSVHNRDDGSIGYYYEARANMFTGFWGVECHKEANPTFTTTGIYMAPTAGSSMIGKVWTHATRCTNLYLRGATGTRPQGFMQGANTQLVWPDVEKSYINWVDMEYYTIRTGITGTAGTTTVLTTSVDHNATIGDYITITGMDDNNSFFEYLQDTTADIEVVAVPASNQITVNVDTSAVTDPWGSDDVTIRFGAVRFRLGMNDSNWILHQSRERVLFKDIGTGNLQLAAHTEYANCEDATGATPDVKGYTCINLKNTTATDVTDFLTPQTNGRLLFVRHEDGNTTIKHGNEIALRYQEDQVGYANLTMLFRYDYSDSKWREMWRSQTYNGSGTWAARPGYPSTGDMYLCTNCTDCRGDDNGTGSYPVWWSGTAWICANGLVENGP